MRILLMQKDAALAGWLKQRLIEDNYEVEVAPDTSQAMSLLTDGEFDLVVLDMDPKADLCVVSEIRMRKAGPPTLLLAAETNPSDRVKALDAGADDYMPKPFYYSELSARIRALLRRRYTPPTATVLELGDLKLDRINRTVSRGSRKIELTPKEFSLLEFLMRRPFQAVPREQIAKQAWVPDGGEQTANVVDVYICYLRKKIDFGAETPLIQTVRGLGYRLGTQASA